MDNFRCTPTTSTPFVRISFDEGVLDISGRSSPENTLEFYQPIIDTVAKFAGEGKDHITANFQYEYFNTSSARCIFLIIKELKKLNEAGIGITINWIVDEDDEDMEETGLDFQDMVDLEFNIKIISGEDEG
ncbi:DUF1987 domain-containing protein [Marinoscillum sp. MHG1-6]|uniref:DUF1987 domain-containing protein n=1 Tax=Marinoscillum sp. MHG1-6 TaxID=2959627 RepID=UPI002157DB87|nr:DUF1987 domain-containing protein [Marinoscillum sp. MHG1-6]